MTKTNISIEDKRRSTYYWVQLFRISSSRISNFFQLFMKEIITVKEVFGLTVQLQITDVTYLRTIFDLKDHGESIWWYQCQWTRSHLLMFIIDMANHKKEFFVVFQKSQNFHYFIHDFVRLMKSSEWDRSWKLKLVESMWKMNAKKNFVSFFCRFSNVCCSSEANEENIQKRCFS